MFHQLVFLSITFFVTGAICLGGALYRLPQFDPSRLDRRIDRLDTASLGFAEGYRRLDKELARLKQDSGEGRGELQRELNIWESQHRELEARVKKIGDDLYRHFSLQMKKPKGGRK